jgi:hypothetical protein
VAVVSAVSGRGGNGRGSVFIARVILKRGLGRP